jgi:ATP-dependent protease ClpP protease subunit
MWEQTQAILSKIEQKLGGKVVSYYTTGSIVADDVKYFYAHLKDIGYQDKLFFVLKSEGGDGKSAYRIASMLRNFCNELTIVIPEQAASAATMLSLAADKIIMTPLAYFTAVDTSIVHPLNPKDKNNSPVSIELEEVKKAVNVLLEEKSDKTDKLEVYKTIFNYIHPVAFGAMERTLNLSERLCKDILALRKDPPSDEEASKLINVLNQEYPSHVYPITRKKARELGLNVIDSDPELDSLLWSFININRYITEPVRTDINDSFFHTEKMINLIESTGRRLVVTNILERRLDPIIKGWTTLKDEYKWLAVYEAMEEGQKKVKVSFVDF